MSFDYVVFDVTATLLTPLHIGSGKQLIYDYDYAIYGGRTWRINEDTLLEAQNIDDPAIVEGLAHRPPSQLLEPADFRHDSPFFRYSLAGIPRAVGARTELQEQLKTVNDEVYLPGSSLKGAIRTSLSWHGWSEKCLKPNTSDLESNRKFAGRRIEKRIMGSDPNHDLLRTLQISDSAPAGKDCLLILNAQVVTRGTLGAPVEIEAVHPDTSFQLTIKIDKALFSDWARKNGLHLGGRSTWLARIPQIIQRHSSQRISEELAWYQYRRGAEQTVGFYQQILKAKLPTNSCLLQMGWGTGWGDKTYGSHLQKDERFMEYLISSYRLAKGNRRKGESFPKSRRSIMRIIQNGFGIIEQRPSVPLGWVLLEIKERKSANSENYYAYKFSSTT